jgi:hypothetical protein
MEKKKLQCQVAQIPYHLDQFNVGNYLVTLFSHLLKFWSQ